MPYLILGLFIFLSNHSIRLVIPSWRDRFIENYGDKTWKAMYSIFSLGGLLLIIYGYQQSRLFPTFLWSPPAWTSHITITLTLFAFILLAASGIKGNHIKLKVGHPMYAGIKVWAFAHLISNGRLGDVLLFGCFMAWAIIGFSVSRRRDRRDGISYPEANGKQTILTLIAGSAAWLIFAFALHAWLIGVSPF